MQASSEITFILNIFPHIVDDFVWMGFMPEGKKVSGIIFFCRSEQIFMSHTRSMDVTLSLKFNTIFIDVDVHIKKAHDAYVESLKFILLIWC